MRKSIKKIVASVVAGAMALAMMVTPNVTAMAEGEATGAGDLILHVKSTVADWGDTTAVHMWGVGTTETKWPGHTMTAETSNAGWYTYELAITGAVNLIFNNNGGKQTGNIEGVVAGEYWYTVSLPEGAEAIEYSVATKAPEGWVVAQKTNAEKFAEKVAAIGTVTLTSEANIKSAEDAYKALTEDEKKTVTEAYATLKKAREDYDALKAKADEEESKKNAAAAGDLTVYVKMPAEEWIGVNIYGWTTGGELFGKFPGTAMTACEGNKGYYKATIKTDGVANLIFASTALDSVKKEPIGQSENIEGISAGTYWYELTKFEKGDINGRTGFTVKSSTTAPTGWVEEKKAEIETQPTTKAPETTTAAEGETTTSATDSSAWDDALLKIHFLNSMEWEKVGVYLTYASWAQLTGAWPGQEMQLEKDSETWYAVCTNADAEEAYNVIFNNMVSDAEADAGEAQKEQTPDTKDLAPGEYWFVLGDATAETDKQITYGVTMFDSVEALEEAGYEYDGNGLAGDVAVDAPEEEEEDTEEEVEEDTEEETTAEKADGATTGDAAPVAVVLLGMVAAVVVVASKKRQNA